MEMIEQYKLGDISKTRAGIMNFCDELGVTFLSVVLRAADWLRVNFASSRLLTL